MISPSPFFVALTLRISGVMIYEIGPSAIVDEIKYNNMGSKVDMELPMNHLSNHNTAT